MLKRLVNEARFQIEITTNGPLLVKSGHATLIGPDMTPVLTFRNGLLQVYIPGSSLKGVFRSHVEKVIRTLRPGEVVVSDPFAKKGPEQSSGNWFNQRKDKETLDNPTVYRQSCPVSRLFGSTWFIGRVSIGDAYLVNESQPLPTEVRDGVGIDRLTGGAAHGAKFNMEVVSAGTQFAADVVLRNFECWQLGALLMVVQDMRDGLIRIGSGRSRGLGAVTAHVPEIAVNHIGPVSNRSQDEIWGLGKYLAPDRSYGTFDDDTLTVTGAPAVERRGVRQVQVFKGEGLSSLMTVALQDFVQRMECYHRYKELV